MTDGPAEPPEKGVAPQILPQPLPRADIIVGTTHLTVTLAIPEAAEHDIEVSVEPRSVHVRSPARPFTVNYLIPLPVSVRTEGWQMGVVNGVVDLVLLRSRTRARVGPAEPS